MIITRTEWESDTVRLVYVDGLPRSPRFPMGAGTNDRFTETPNRPISEIFIHQSAGNEHDGVGAAVSIAQFHAAPPVYKLDPSGRIMYRSVRGVQKRWWVGGGRGWPGIG
jgi:hypothetical protein